MGRTSEDLASRLWPDRLQEVQDALSRSSGVPVLAVDYSGRPLAACEDLTQFCRRFTRAVTISRPCFDCGRSYEPQQYPESQASALQWQPPLYSCPLGPVDLVSPIFCAGDTLGYLISAQVLLSSMNEQEESVEKLQMAHENEELWALLNRLPLAELTTMVKASAGLSAAAWLISSLITSRRRNLRLSEQLRAQCRNLRELAVTDPVTGVANKKRFMEALETEIQRARRYGRPFTLVALEIEDFLDINDEFGHEIGDAVLAETARCLVATLRQTDLIGRTSSHGFSLLLPETARPQAYIVVARIQAVVEDLNASGELPVEVKLAAGIVDNLAEAPIMYAAVREEVKRNRQLESRLI